MNFLKSNEKNKPELSEFQKKGVIGLVHIYTGVSKEDVEKVVNFLFGDELEELLKNGNDSA